MEDKLVVVGGDHGNRFSWSRTSLGGRFEERMPFMSVSLPHRHGSMALYYSERGILVIFSI